MRATYSPEDNKLRLYSTHRLDTPTWERVKAAGFKWAPKQAEAAGYACLVVAPAWTPDREDLLLELCDEIEDEDYSATERAADRAERFDGYREKRTGEAIDLADRFEDGPAAFGHQNAARAQRQADRHDRHRTHAVSQWSKAEYWTSRTAGVIANALHRANPAVRRSRILTLEAEERKHNKTREEYAARFDAWTRVAAMPDNAAPLAFEGYTLKSENPAARLAYTLANSIGCYGEYAHPRTGRKSSLYSLLTDHADPITPAEAAALWLDRKPRPDSTESYMARWSAHYALRLTYERAMLENEGGTAGDVEMQPGGLWKGGLITKVNKSNTTGAVVSVLVHCPDKGGGYDYLRRGDAIMCNVQRSGEGHYTPPTPETLAQLAAIKAAKAESKAAKPAAPKLINPTDEDAQKLQDIWNARRSKAAPSQVVRMTQEQYSARSQGGYAQCATMEVTEKLKERWGGSRLERDQKSGRVVVFKVRHTGPTGDNWGGADRVIVITDKPQSPIPWAEIERVKAELPTVESMTPRIEELRAALSTGWLPNDGTPELQLIEDACYIGWAWKSSLSQFGWTEAGAEVLKKHQAEAQPVTV